MDQMHGQSEKVDGIPCQAGGRWQAMKNNPTRAAERNEHSIDEEPCAQNVGA